MATGKHYYIHFKCNKDDRETFQDTFYDILIFLDKHSAQLCFSDTFWLSMTAVL